MVAAGDYRRTPREVDYGERCERHVGEVYPPRCSDCDRADAGDAFPTRCVDCAPGTGGDVIDRGETKRLAGVLSRAGYIPGSACALHVDYPLPCNRCQRDSAAAA